MKYLSIIFLFSINAVFSQTFSDRELKASISEVTIFLQGAEVLRNGTLDIPQGKSRLIVKSLSPFIDGKSVQVKATGDFTILSVNHRQNYLTQLKKDERVEQLRQELEALEGKISLSRARVEVLREKQSLLSANKSLDNEASGANLEALKQALEFYDEELSSIKNEELAIQAKIRDLQDKKLRIEKEIADALRKEELPTGEIEIRVDAPEKTKGSFKISYLVANARWYPKYDVRVSSIEKPLELRYKADVYQNTGIHWENVKLKLSNGNPNQSGVAPELETWYLNYARNTRFKRADYQAMASNVRSVSGRIVDEYGEALPGATVLVKGTTVGTVTDLNGDYTLTLPNGASELVVSFIGYATQELPISSSMINARLNADVMQLSEVVVSGLSGSAAGVRIRGAKSIGYSVESEFLTTTTIENQTTVEFEIAEPYSIQSNGEKLTVDVNRFEVEADYEYYAVPKLDKDAFLIARVINWDRYNLLEGEANLYFEEAFVGRSILDAKSLSDTLDISLGRDKSIVIGRTKIDDFTRRRTIGSNKIESRGYEIIARNKKSQPIKLTLFDQLPIAAINDITVTHNELSGGTLIEKTGEVTWVLELKPQQQVELKLGYEVKYPKSESVVLD